ncbi:MAG TPA: hypothetical protein VH518_12190 [Tepidisphaeraceae bacterium]|jgi:hypothetical protein
MWLRCAILSLLIVSIAGCAAPPQPPKFENPSFRVTPEQASQAIEQMRADPKVLPRPLIVVGGFMDPNITTPWFAHFFAGVTRETTIITVPLGTCTSFDECRDTIIAAVDKVRPSDDPIWTSEVDVIGLSLGGLASRYAAAPPRDASHPRRLKIARLFTISSPHTGAKLAQRISLIDFHRDMIPGSPFLTYVAAHDDEANYTLYPYTHLNDDIVGAQYAAPPGVTPWWLRGPPTFSPHLAAMLDDRILADIARRLRGEEPFTRSPAAPLPAN